MFVGGTFSFKHFVMLHMFDVMYVEFGLLFNTGTMSPYSYFIGKLNSFKKNSIYLI